MKWVILVIALVIGGIAYKHFVYDLRHPLASSPSGLGGVFEIAAKAGDDAKIRSICEPASGPQAIEVAHRVASVTYQQPLMWQAMKPEHGEGAVTAQLTGAGKVLVIEWNKVDSQYRIHSVALTDY